jgi:hypothetical protein
MLSAEGIRDTCLAVLEDDLGEYLLPNGQRVPAIHIGDSRVNPAYRVNCADPDKESIPALECVIAANPEIEPFESPLDNRLVWKVRLILWDDRQSFINAWGQLSTHFRFCRWGAKITATDKWPTQYLFEVLDYQSLIKIC